MSETQQDQATLILAAQRGGTEFPSELSAIMNMDDAYAVQFALLELRQQSGEKPVGWKVGLTAKAMQQQQGMHEPVLGHLMQAGHLQSPAELAFDGMVEPGFENELCLRIKSELSGPDISFDAAAAAIDAVAPAIEIIEKRGLRKDGLPLAMAGNAQQRAFVTGNFVPYSLHQDLAAVSVTVTVNGDVKETAFGAEVLGNPINSVVWLAAKLTEFGLQLHPGDLIMSGSFTKQYDFAKGDQVAVEFSDFGSAKINVP